MDVWAHRCRYSAAEFMAARYRHADEREMQATGLGVGVLGCVVLSEIE